MAHDHLITGAEPAGSQLAALLERDGRDAGPGTFVTRRPGHRTLISIDGVHTGCTDPGPVTGQRVVVIGEGDSDFETADALVEDAVFVKERLAGG
jgi:hypothetical protein